MSHDHCKNILFEGMSNMLCESWLKMMFQEGFIFIKVQTNGCKQDSYLFQIYNIFVFVLL